jgi:hypothetical protein
MNHMRTLIAEHDPTVLKNAALAFHGQRENHKPHNEEIAMLYVLQRRLLTRADEKKVIGRRIAATALVTAAVLIGATVAMVQPAHAASGGGCHPPHGNDPLSSCISFNGSDVVADFYLNHNPDFSRCYARIEIRETNVFDNKIENISLWSDLYSLTRTGRYGPYSDFVYPTIPPSHGSAVNRVHFYRCDGTRHHYWDSPRVYWP